MLDQHNASRARSLSLSRGPLLPPLLPREKNPNASRARSLHSSQRKHPPHALSGMLQSRL
jgi:hypothetical protein